MKISLVPMRAPARARVLLPAAPPAAMPTVTLDAGVGPETPQRPAGVSALAWEMLAMHVGDAQRRSAIAYAPLRLVVQAVVRELRATQVPWDAVYLILQSAVTPDTGAPARFAMEFEMHTSRAAALVAHMHSWADVERLAELAVEDGDEGVHLS